MRYEFDPTKNARNIQERGINFEIITQFDWSSAVIWQDLRNDYQEERQCALGFIGDRLHNVVFVDRGEFRRIISLRKANQRERKNYAKVTA